MSGRTVSDRHLTAHSGFLDKLTHGDLVFADRGFDIAGDLSLIGDSLAIPHLVQARHR